MINHDYSKITITIIVIIVVIIIISMHELEDEWGSGTLNI